MGKPKEIQVDLTLKNFNNNICEDTRVTVRNEDGNHEAGDVPDEGHFGVDDASRDTLIMEIDLRS